ncbi:MAG: GGDEF domain-containing protein [Treponema sp.]|nr:GGDEF domain-containing protein [Treponema sp.]
MNKKIFIPVYSVIVSLIFLGTIVFSGISLYNENNKGYIKSKSKFDTLCLDVKKVFENPNDPRINENLQKAIGSYNAYSFMTIKIDGETVFLYPGDRETPAENTKFSKLYFKSVRLGDSNLYLAASLYTLSPSTIAFYAKISFIIVLIFTVLTILLIVYISINEEKNIDDIQEEETIEENLIESEPVDEKIIEDSPSEETGLVDPNILEKTVVTEDNIKDFENTIISEPESEEVIEEEIKEETEVTEEEKEVTEEEKEEVCIEKTAIEPINEKAIELPVEDFKPSDNENSNPNGLFSDVSGFGWESYLTTRLENELVRASSSEFDLCLFIIQLKDIARDSEEMKKSSDVILSYFQFKDMIFEYKDDCYAAIKTNTTIDEAIIQADSLYSDLMNAVGDKGKCYIGISSKTIRLIGADRLLKEADAALEHAKEDPDAPIIAFRANAEKYMDYIDHN